MLATFDSLPPDERPAALTLKPIHGRIRTLLALAERLPRRADELSGDAAAIHRTHVAPLFGFLIWLDSYLEREAAPATLADEAELAALNALHDDLQLMDDLLSAQRGLAEIPTRRAKVEELLRRCRDEREQRIAAEAECLRLRQKLSATGVEAPDTADLPPGGLLPQPAH